MLWCELTDDGRLLLECLIGLLILCTVLGLAPGGVASTARLSALELADGREARCLRDTAASVMTYGTKGKVPDRCVDTISLRCAPISAEREVCSLALTEHGTVPAATLIVKAVRTER